MSTKVLPAQRPTAPNQWHRLVGRVRWHRPRCTWPEFEVVCTLWDKLPAGEWRILAEHSKTAGNMSMEDAAYYRGHFRRVANRYSLFASMHYTTRIEGRTLLIMRLPVEPGLPALSSRELEEYLGLIRARTDVRPLLSHIGLQGSLALGG